MVKETATNYRTIGLDLQFKNFYEVRDILAQMGGGEFVRGSFKQYAEAVLEDSRYYAFSITHAITGSLRASHRWQYDSHTMRGSIFIDPHFGYYEYNTWRLPSEYGVYEHNRGGDHAFYARTISEKTQFDALVKFSIITRSVDILWSGVR